MYGDRKNEFIKHFLCGGFRFLWGYGRLVMVCRYYLFLFFRDDIYIGFIAGSALLGKFVLTKVFRRHKKSPVLETLLDLVLWWFIGWIPWCDYQDGCRHHRFWRSFSGPFSPQISPCDAISNYW
jgi:hypothetical protein